MIENWLSSGWFERATVDVARELLGTILIHQFDDAIVSGRIVETEAYLGEEDAASHAALYRRGREALSRPAGRIYMYRAYGVHAMFNIVTESPATHGAVLIRAIEPVEGIDRMIARRGVPVEHRLGQGPGNLCVAMGFTLADDDRDLGHDSEIWIAPGPPVEQIGVSVRIGITKNADAPLRFFDPTSRAVSGSRKSLVVASNNIQI
ncbi:MAG: DNA-3-methyladenine glycosylase [Thermomicrobiales bacterium]